MLILKASTPHEAVSSIVEYLMSESARYTRQSVAAIDMTDKRLDMARANAMKMAAGSIRTASLRGAPDKPAA